MDAANSVYVGKPLIEAYQLEQSQAWSGGALTSTAVARLPQEAQTGQFVYDWWLTPYEIPLKDGIRLKTLAVDWTAGLHHSWNFRFLWSNTSEQPTIKDWKEQPDVCEKWQNTKTFHDSVCRLCEHSI